jgi:ABC-2 type transport system permease protein
MSAPVSHVEMVAAFVGAAVTKSMILATLVLATSAIFVPLEILHPAWMLGFLLLTSVTFCLFGFILGVWAKSWEQLWIIPGLVVTPLTFLGGAFYSIDMLPPAWQTVALFNPVVYLISGFRWSFYGQADVAVGISLLAVLAILLICFAIVAWIFKTGYRLKS